MAQASVIGTALTFAHQVTRELVLRFLFFAIPIGVATFVTIYMFYHMDVEMSREIIHETEHHHLELRDLLIRRNIENVASDVKVLASSVDPHSMMRLEQGALEQHLLQHFLVYCRQHSQLDEIDLLSADGTALMRVVCARGRPLAFTRDEDHLFKRGGQMAQLAALQSEGVFISGMEAEPHLRERGEVRPVVYFATPLRAALPGGRQYVVASVDLRYLVPDLLIDTGEGGTMILVQEDGKFLRRPSAREPWGAALEADGGRKFAEAVPAVWETLWAAPTGQIETADGLFSFTTMYPMSVLGGEEGGAPHSHDSPDAHAEGYAWKIVSYVSQDELSAGMQTFMRKFTVLIPVMLILPLLVTLYLAYIWVKREAAVRDLEENERYLRKVMNNVVDGIVTIDAEGHVHRANTAMERLFQLSGDELRARQLQSLFAPEQWESAAQLVRFWQASRHSQGEVVRCELEAQRKDGTRFPAELIASDMLYGGERLRLAIVRDISERRALEAKQEAERMQFFHQTKMAEIGLLAAGIIHEVGNPIAAIAGLVGELRGDAANRREALSDDVNDSLEVIAQQAQRLSGITRDISDFVRQRPGMVELFDLNTLIRSTVRLIQYDRRWKYIELEWGLDDRIPAITGIPDQIAQVVMNLLVNASDAVADNEPGRRTVRVSTESDGSTVTLTVSDNGHGMSEEVKRRAFESFFTTKPEGKGTGLGLALCSNIVVNHGGEIQIDSSPDSGTTMRVVLPVDVAAAAATA